MTLFPMPPVKWEFPPDEDHHWEVELTAAQRLALLDLILGKRKPRREILKSLLEAVGKARRLEGPLLPGKLDWEEIEREAKRQGCSAADLIWDRARGREE